MFAIEHVPRFSDQHREPERVDHWDELNTLLGKPGGFRQESCR